MLNITKSHEPVLVGGKHYTDKGLKKKTLEKCKTDFFNLCYLCEEHSPRHDELDHFYPQKFFPAKVDDWNNLFLICEKCNKIRPKDINSQPNKEIYNNCTDDVENLIELRYDFENKQISITSSEKTIKAKNTVKLLERIYNGKGSDSIDYLELQTEIRNKITHFTQALNNYQNLKIPSLKDNYINMVVEFFQKEYNLRVENIDYNKVGFVSFKRQLIKDNSSYLGDFQLYFD